MSITLKPEHRNFVGEEGKKEGKKEKRKKRTERKKREKQKEKKITLKLKKIDIFSCFL